VVDSAEVLGGLRTGGLSQVHGILPPPPSGLAISPTSGPTAGGTHVTITGAGLTDAFSAKVGGNPITSFLVVDDTHITGVTAAHAAGATDVVVAGPGGSATDPGAFTFVAPYDPATNLSLTAWWQGDNYNPNVMGTATALGSVSLGTSGNSTQKATQGAGIGAPSVGASLNGHPTMSFNSANRTQLATANAASNYLNDHTWSAWALVDFSTASANSGVPYLNSLIIDTEGFFAVWSLGAYDNSGTPNFQAYETSAGNVVVNAGTYNAWHLLQARSDGSTIEFRLDSGSWGSHATSAIPTLANSVNIAAGAFMDALVAEIALADTKFNDATFDNIKSYINTRYGLSL
jgi:hypothetical protein